MSDTEPDPFKIIPWVLLGVGSIVGTLWAAFQGGNSKRIAALEASVKHEQEERRRERDEYKTEKAELKKEHREEIDRLEMRHKLQCAELGDRLDASNLARERDAYLTTRMLVRARTETGAAAEWEADAPSKVKTILDFMSPESSIDELLRNFDPEGKRKPPRARMGSRPRLNPLKED